MELRYKKIKVNDGIRQLWKSGYFGKHRNSNDIKEELLEKIGLTSSNINAHLRSCSSVLRKEREGWIQKMKYFPKQTTNAEKENVELTLLSVASDSYLIAACEDSYKSKKYWDMALFALRHMEVRTRSKARLSASDFGVGLMEKVFKPSVGILKIPSCATEGEEDGFKHIMKGMMMFHRNAKGHREEEINRLLALKIVGYVDYLIQVIESSKKRELSSQIKF